MDGLVVSLVFQLILVTEQVNLSSYLQTPVWHPDSKEIYLRRNSSMKQETWNKSLPDKFLKQLFYKSFVCLW